jgi:hypothetical protein
MIARGGRHEKGELQRIAGRRNRLSRERAHAEQAATIAGMALLVGIRVIRRRAVIAVMMHGAVAMHMWRAAVVMRLPHAVLLGQAMYGRCSIREGERNGGRENAKGI